MSRWTTDSGLKSHLNSCKIQRLASCIDWRSWNFYLLVIPKKFFVGTKRSPLSSSFAKLPSRWIQVSSTQVEGGDVVARLRRQDSCVSKSIPGKHMRKPSVNKSQPPLSKKKKKSLQGWTPFADVQPEQNNIAELNFVRHKSRTYAEVVCAHFVLRNTSDCDPPGAPQIQ